MSSYLFFCMQARLRVYAFVRLIFDDVFHKHTQGIFFIQVHLELMLMSCIHSREIVAFGCDIRGLSSMISLSTSNFSVFAFHVLSKVSRSFWLLKMIFGGIMVVGDIWWHLHINGMVIDRENISRVHGERIITFDMRWSGWSQNSFVLFFSQFFFVLIFMDSFEWFNCNT